MKKTAAHRVVWVGALIGLGVLIPFAVSHSAGIPGTALLPMHIPVFLIGLLFGPIYGAFGGVVTPVLSSVLTGMPPVFPMLPLMVGELFTYGLVSGLLHEKKKVHVMPSLLIAMVCGRITYAVIFQTMFMMNGNSLPRALSVTAAAMTGLPGIIAQLILLPAIVYAVNRSRKTDSEPLSLTFAKAKSMVRSKKTSCVVIKEDKILRSAAGHGIAPLISIYEEDPRLMQGSCVVDKLIGKAAAVVILLGGATKAHGETMSVSARDYLTKHGCEISFDKLIETVNNRKGDGICPLENSVIDVDDPSEGYQMLKKTIKQLTNAG